MNKDISLPRIILDSSFILDRVYYKDKNELDEREFLERCKFYRDKYNKGLQIPNHIREEVKHKLIDFNRYPVVSHAFRILSSIQPTQNIETLKQNTKDISLYDKIINTGRKVTNKLRKSDLSRADVGYCLHVLSSAKYFDVHAGTYDRGIIETILEVFENISHFYRGEDRNTKIDFVRGNSDLYTLVNGYKMSGSSGYDERGNKKPMILSVSRPIFKLG